MILDIIENFWCVVGMYACFSAALLWVFYRLFNRPMLISFQRVLCSLACIAIIIFTLFTVILIIYVFKSSLAYNTISGAGDLVWYAFFALWSIGLNLIFIFKLWKTFWYCASQNTKTIEIYWYMQKYLALKANKKNAEKKYVYLQKVSELKPDDFFSWSTMSMFNEFYFDKPEQADVCLEKAKQILAADEHPTELDKATLENTIGELLMHRNNAQGIEHLKKACELNPAPFIKERYEEALEYLDSQDE